MNATRVRWIYLRLVLALACQGLTPSHALDFMKDMTAGQEFNEAALQAVGKTWNTAECMKWVDAKKLSPGQATDLNRFMVGLQKKIGPMQTYTKGNRSNLLHHLTLTGDVVTCESNFDLQCQKGKATAKLMAAREGSSWKLLNLDVDSPLMHQGAVAVADQRALAYNDTAVLDICQSWDQNKLLQHASPELRATIDKDPSSLSGIFATYRTMLGGIKARQQTKLITSTISQGKYIYAFETPFQFERTSAKVQTQVVGDQSGWRLIRFNVHTELHK